MNNLDTITTGRLIRDSTGYSYFLPELINQSWTWDDQQLNSLLEKAAIRLGELNANSKLVPDIDLFIQLHVTNEAVISSRIEGTQTKIDEAFLHVNDVYPERRDDWREVHNYILAMNRAISELDSLPISSRLIKLVHAQLLDGVRGDHKQPGEFRTSQNWIGGSSLADAVFIPPHPVYLNDLMSDLEKFINNTGIKLPALIKIAMVHYQFETIHPFLDGNERIGRLLITLFLIEQKILSRPLLYLSSYFEKNKNLYYDNLTAVRTKNDMKQWLKYFLVGIAETAEIATQTLSSVLQLKSDIEKRINYGFGKRSTNAIIILHELFKRPVIQVNEVKNITNVSFKTANDLVGMFVREGILREQTGQYRNRIFLFDPYLNLFKQPFKQTP